MARAPEHAPLEEGPDGGGGARLFPPELNHALLYIASNGAESAAKDANAGRLANLSTAACANLLAVVKEDVFASSASAAPSKPPFRVYAHPLFALACARATAPHALRCPGLSQPWRVLVCARRPPTLPGTAPPWSSRGASSEERGAEIVALDGGGGGRRAAASRQRVLSATAVSAGYDGGGGVQVKPPHLEFTLAHSAAVQGAWAAGTVTPAPLPKHASVISEALIFGDGGDDVGVFEGGSEQMLRIGKQQGAGRLGAEARRVQLAESDAAEGGSPGRFGMGLQTGFALQPGGAPPVGMGLVPTPAGARTRVRKDDPLEEGYDGGGGCMVHPPQLGHRGGKRLLAEKGGGTRALVPALEVTLAQRGFDTSRFTNGQQEVERAYLPKPNYDVARHQPPAKPLSAHATAAELDAALPYLTANPSTKLTALQRERAALATLLHRTEAAEKAAMLKRDAGMRQLRAAQAHLKDARAVVEQREAVRTQERALYPPPPQRPPLWLSVPEAAPPHQPPVPPPPTSHLSTSRPSPLWLSVPEAAPAHSHPVFAPLRVGSARRLCLRRPRRWQQRRRR